MRAVSRPAPSSLHRDQHLGADIARRELDPARCRSCRCGCGASALSMPWSMALRMRWTSGSARRSIMVLSSSVSSPIVTKSTGLPRSRDRSWTRRRKRPNSEPIGTMRMPMVVSRRPEARRSISSAMALMARSVPECASWVSRAWAMTSSPTRSISSSRRSAGTRTVEPLSSERRLGSMRSTAVCDATSWGSA